MRSFTLAYIIALALWPLIARAVSADDAELPGQTSEAVTSLPQFRLHLAMMAGLTAENEAIDFLATCG